MRPIDAICGYVLAFMGGFHLAFAFQKWVEYRYRAQWKHKDANGCLVRYRGPGRYEIAFIENEGISSTEISHISQRN